MPPQIKSAAGAVKRVAKAAADTARDTVFDQAAHIAVYPDSGVSKVVNTARVIRALGDLLS